MRCLTIFTISIFFHTSVYAERLIGGITRKFNSAIPSEAFGLLDSLYKADAVTADLLNDASEEEERELRFIRSNVASVRQTLASLITNQSAADTAIDAKVIDEQVSTRLQQSLAQLEESVAGPLTDELIIPEHQMNGLLNSVQKASSFANELLKISPEETTGAPQDNPVLEREYEALKYNVYRLRDGAYGDVAPSRNLVNQLEDVQAQSFQALHNVATEGLLEIARIRASLNGFEPSSWLALHDAMVLYNATTPVVNSKTIGEDLDNAETTLLNILEEPANLYRFESPEVLSLPETVESVTKLEESVADLSGLYHELFGLGERLRFLRSITDRDQRIAVSKIDQNNMIRAGINRLNYDLTVSAKKVQSHIANDVANGNSSVPFAVNIKELNSRLAKIRNMVESFGMQQRFREDLFSLTKDLHRLASSMRGIGVVAKAD